MKKYLGTLLLSIFLFVAFAAPVSATSNIAVNAGYWKAGNTFDVVVKENPSAKLKLYVNDAHPVAATVNKKGWATFKKVSLHDSGKISFTRLTGSGKKHEQPINYTRQFKVDGHKVSFTSAKPKVAQPAPAPKVEPAPTPAPAPAPTPAPDPAPAPKYEPTPAPDPYGPTARCSDGTYSYSQNHRGTCSHHGGVAEWLD